MRSKDILSIAAFVAAFALSAAFASLFISQPTPTTTGYALTSTSNYTPRSYCNLNRKSPTAAAISTLIANDHANGRVRSSRTYDIDESYPPSFNSVAFTDYADNIESYVDASSNMATNNLPRDFKAAWREHMKAWRDYSKFLIRTANLSNRNSMTQDEFDEAEVRYNTEISRTWYEVLEIGNSYGANVQ